MSRSVSKRRRTLVAVGLVPMVTLSVVGLQALSAAAAPADVSVNWQVTSDWGTGFQADIAVTNQTSSAINPWSVAFAYGSRVSSVWDATMTATSNGFAASGPNWSRSLAPGATVRFGLIGQRASGSSPIPSSCTVTGRSCVLTSATGSQSPSQSVSASPSASQSMSASPSASVSATAAPTAAPTSPGVADTTVVAPYVDMGLWPPADLNAMSAATGVRTFTAAFVVQDAAKACVPAWGGYSAYGIGGSSDFADTIGAFTGRGGRVIVSFGGASGSELADTCTDDAALLAAYRKVIDRYGLDRIDFDIEGASVANATANQRRARVVAALQRDYAARGRTIEVSLTLPVMPDGLDANGQRTVREFAAAGVRLAAVNVMAMDYGQAYTDMGTHAITAVQGTVSQLRAIPAFSGYSTARLYAMVGVTPMIGQNDVPTEVFTLADASKVASFVKANGVGQLSWWETTRDKPCTPGAQALYLCTYTSNPQWAYSKAFVAGLGASNASSPATPSPATPSPTNPSPVTPSPTNPSPSGSASAPASSPVGSGLSVQVKVTSDWGSGRNVDLVITNRTGAPITNWSIAMPWAGTVSTMWNARGGTSNGTLTAANESWNGSLGAGASANVGVGESGPLTLPTACRATVGGVNVPCAVS